MCASQWKVKTINWMYKVIYLIMNECTNCEKCFLRNEYLFKEKSYFVLFSKKGNISCKYVED